MAHVQIIPGNFNITDPDAPIYQVRKTITSDTFPGVAGQPFSATETSAELGGKPFAWAGVQRGWTYAGTGISPNAEVGYGIITLPGLPVFSLAELTVAQLPTSGQFNLAAYGEGESNTRTLLRVYSTGGFEVNQEGGPGRLWSGGAGSLSDGDRLGLLIEPDALTILINGVALKKVDLGRPVTPTIFGISHFQTAESGEITDLVISGI